MTTIFCGVYLLTAVIECNCLEIIIILYKADKIFNNIKNDIFIKFVIILLLFSETIYNKKSNTKTLISTRQILSKLYKLPLIATKNKVYVMCSINKMRVKIVSRAVTIHKK